MIQNFTVSGMTCQGCGNKLAKAIGSIIGVKSARVDFNSSNAEVESDGGVSIAELNTTLANLGKYKIETAPERIVENILPVENKNSIRQFIPLITALSLVILWTLIRASQAPLLHFHNVGQDFMAGFFLIFGTLKILGYKGFIKSFRQYDPIAKFNITYAYIYPALEILLGLSFLFNTFTLLANFITIVVLSSNALGVWQAVQAKQKIKCACLGGWFQIPITWITFVEDVVMVGMAMIMIFIK